MNWPLVGDQIRARLSDATDAELFRFWVCLAQDRPYGWGRESISGTDCSGSVALGLVGAGYNVRLTANDYLRLVFTIRPGSIYDPEDIAAIFYVANTDRKHGDLMVAAGVATHVTPIVGDGVVFDAEWGQRARLRSADFAIARHKAWGTTPVVASVDWTALDTLHRSGRFPVDDKEINALLAKEP